MKKNGKYELLTNWFGERKKIAIAFSGGTDSTFLLALAKNVLQQNVLALTVKTPYIPDWELNEAMEFCRTEKINHRVLYADAIPDIMDNPVNRCYLCKKHLFSLLKNEAAAMGYNLLADGTNADDKSVYRPGLKALKELHISSPLLENGLTKKDIRRYSKKMGLPTASKPPYACLLTRLPYNSGIDYEVLTRIEKAEKFLISLGFPGSRVRTTGDTARIEADKRYLPKLVRPENASMITGYFHDLGYRHISVDLEGYRSGSFDQKIVNLNHAPCET